MPGIRNIYVEALPLDRTTGAPVTIRMCRAGSSSDGTISDGKYWVPAVTKRHAPSMSLASDGLLTAPDTTTGSLEFNVSSDLDNESWTALEWYGAQARIWIGVEGDPLTSYSQVFQGSLGSISRKEARAAVPLLGPEAQLQRDLLTLTYTGVGGAEGPADMIGNLKPRAFGACETVEPVQINGAYDVYQVHGYGPVDAIPNVYDFGIPLDSAKYKGDAASYDALIFGTLARGEWATCLAQGMFRLGATPTHVSADVTVGTGTIAAIGKTLLNGAGVPDGQIGDLSQFATKKWCLYQTSQVSVLDVVRSAFAQGGGYLFADGKGTWQTGDWFAPKAAIRAADDGSTSPALKSISELSSAAPVWSVDVGYRRCWYVHGQGDVSPAVAQVTDLALAQAQAIEDAQKAADAAQADADAAKLRIQAYDSDGVFTSIEKLDIIRRFGDAAAEYTGLDNQGSQFNVTAERAAYVSKYQALKTYLEGLSPAYTDLTQDTKGIDPAVDQQKWNDYFAARAALRVALTGKAATTSNYSGITDDNGKKPDDNATNSADPASAFGNQGKTVADITSAISAIQQNPSLDTTPPAVPTGLSIGSTVAPQGNSASLVFGWSAVADSDLAYYELQAGLNGGSLNTIYQGSSTAYLLNGQLPNTPVQAKVRAVDKAGNTSAWSATASGTTAKDTTPPGQTNGINVVVSVGSAFVTWTNPSDADLAGVTVYWGPDTNFAHVVGSATVNAKPGATGSFTQSGIAGGTTRCYWAEAYDTSGNKSALNGPFQTYINDLTLDASKLTGTIATGQLNGSTVASVLATSGLTPPLSVNKANINDGSVTAIAFAQTAFNANDGKLYRNADGTKLATTWLPVYTDASSIAGQITTTQITDSAVTSLKLAGKSVVAGKLDADAVTAGTIAAAAISTRELQAGSVTASKIAVVADNLNPDPLLQDTGLWHQNNSNGVDYPTGTANSATGWYPETGDTAIVAAVNALHNIVLWSGSGINNSIRHHYYMNDKIIPLIGGKTYEVSATFQNASNQTIRVDFQHFRPDWSDGQGVGVYMLANGTGQTVTTFTCPADHSGGRFVVYNEANSTFSGVARVSNLQIREQLGGTMIVDGSLTAGKIKAGEITANEIKSGSLTGDRFSTSTSLPGTITVGSTGVSIETVRTTASDAKGTANTAYSWANDPAARVNANNSTQINPGLINISGGTTLASWRNGGDNTKIEGGSIAANTITANKVTIGTRGVQLLEIAFDTNRVNTVSWRDGYVEWMDDNNNRRVDYMRGGSEYFDPNNGVAVVWVWFDRAASPNAFGDGSGHLFSGMPGGGAAEIMRNPNNVILCSYRNGNLLNVYYGKTIIDGDFIKTGTISADRLISNTVLANTISVQGRGTLNQAFDSASWGGVSGRPGSLSDLDNGAAGKLNGIQNNATNGAPAGSYVGNTEAQQVTNWANLGAQDPAGRINNGTTTIQGGMLSTGTIYADKIVSSGITRQYFATIGQDVVGSGDYQDVSPVNFYLDYASDVLVIATGSQNYFGSVPDWQVNIQLDGNQQAGASGGAGVFVSSWALSASWQQVGPGWHTAKVSWRGGDSGLHLTACGVTVLRAYR